MIHLTLSLISHNELSVVNYRDNVYLIEIMCINNNLKVKKFIYYININIPG